MTVLETSDLPTLMPLVADMKQNASLLDNVLIQVQVQLLEQAIEQNLPHRISHLLSRIEASVAQLETSPSQPKESANHDSRSVTSIRSKYIGSYLVEAELLTPVQVQLALIDQQKTGMRFGDVLVSRGWIKRGTIEYIAEKIIQPERELEQRKYPASGPVEAWQKTGGNSIHHKETFIG